MDRFSLSKHRFPNGLTVFHCRVPESAGFELAMNIDTGSRDETQANNGVSHFLEHMMFRGSDAHPDSIALARALEDFGGESNAMTSVESTVYWLRGATRKIDAAFDAFADFFLRPRFTDLETERAIVLQELANDYNEDGDNIDSESLAMRAMFDEHPLGLPIIGTEEVLKRLTEADLKEKLARFYRPSNCVLTVTCSLPFEDVRRGIERSFGSHWLDPAPSGAYPTRQPFGPENFKLKAGKKFKNAIKLQNNADNQFSLKVMFPCTGGMNRHVVEDVFLERILDDGICSRLPANIRERHGLVYDISADSMAYSDIGTFSIDATVSRDHLKRLMDTLGDELRKMTDETPSAEEMERIRFRYAFDLELLKESESRVLSRDVANHFLNTEMSIDDELDMVRAMTAEDVRDAAQRMLSAPRRSFVLIGPKARKKRDDVEKFMERLS